MVFLNRNNFEGINASKCIIPRKFDENVMELINVIERQGENAFEGHYWSYIRRNTEFLKCNDSVISDQVQEKEFFESKCSYMFLFRPKIDL